MLAYLETDLPVSLTHERWVGLAIEPDHRFSYFKVTDQRDWERELERLGESFESAEVLKGRVTLLDDCVKPKFIFYRADLFRYLPFYSKELEEMMAIFFQSKIIEQQCRLRTELLSDYLIHPLNLNDVKGIIQNTVYQHMYKRVLIVDKVGNIIENSTFEFNHAFFNTYLEEALLLDHYLPEGDEIFKRRTFGEELELQSRKGFVISII